jgi:tRNA A-37 threonylcarbamoyl transferase component Bud32
MGHSAEPQSTAADASRQPTVSVEADLTGKTLGDYHLVRRLGQGGMGQVYLAEQVSLKRKVALKLLRADIAANSVALQRFKHEAESVARATHANIVQVYAIHEVNGLHYMALEYVEGRNLRQFLEKKGPPEVIVALSIMRQVAAALQRASELGIIHRDIKPENILITRKGEVKVTDFGLSRAFGEDVQPVHLTASGVAMGTPLYMSPEQVESKPVDPRTDIYSFGVTCYHMLAGEPPFRGQSAFEVAVQHVQKEPEPLAHIRPDLPAELCDLVHKMMAKRPEERIQTGREVVREVMRLRDNLVGVTSGQPGTSLAGMFAGDGVGTTSTQTMTLPAPRRQLAWIAALTILLALGGGLAIGWWQQRGRGQANSNDEDMAARPSTAVSEREKFLIEAVKQHAKPDAVQFIRRGLEDRIDLGLLYLKNRELEKAERFFKLLDGSLDEKDEFVNLFGRQGKLKAYQDLGKLGQAMVLAFQADEPAKLDPKKKWTDQEKSDRSKNLAMESMNKFTSVFQPKPPLPADKEFTYFWQRHPPLREMIAIALDHNVANGAPRTKIIDFWRKPPPPIKPKSML